MYVTEAFADATKNPYSFMLMDLRPETPDNMRLIGNYGRDNADPMVIYSPQLYKTLSYYFTPQLYKTLSYYFLISLSILVLVTSHLTAR